MPAASPALQARPAARGAALRLPCPPSGLLLLCSATAIWAPEAVAFLPPSAPPLTRFPLDPDPADKDQTCSRALPSRGQRSPRVGGGWTFSWPPPTRDPGDFISYPGLWPSAWNAPRPPSGSHSSEELARCSPPAPPGAALQGFFSVSHQPVHVGLPVPLPAAKSPCSLSTGTFFVADFLQPPPRAPSLPPQMEALQRPLKAAATLTQNSQTPLQGQAAPWDPAPRG